MSRRCRSPLRVGICAVLVAAGFVLGGCGQTGPLYLPPPKAATAKPATAKPAPAKTAPAPASAAR